MHFANSKENLLKSPRTEIRWGRRFSLMIDRRAFNDGPSWIELCEDPIEGTAFHGRTSSRKRLKKVQYHLLHLRNKYIPRTKRGTPSRSSRILSRMRKNYHLFHSVQFISLNHLLHLLTSLSSSTPDYRQETPTHEKKIHFNPFAVLTSIIWKIKMCYLSF